MDTILITCLVAAAAYLGIGIFHARRVRSVRDFIPQTGDSPHVKNSADFSGSTVSTTISLATVVIAIFDLYPAFRFWLLWTALTTAAGLLVVRLFASRIWERMSAGRQRFTLHEFLGDHFDSKPLKLVASSVTSLGFLGAFAIEISVGGRFLGTLSPHLSTALAFVLVGLVIMVGLGSGGYRASIVSERIQMWTIYGFLIALTIVLLANHGTQSPSFSQVFDKTSWPVDASLAWFMVGIFLINVPTFLADMSVWQRISGSKDRKTMMRGLTRSTIGSAVTWTWIVVLAFLGSGFAKGDATGSALFEIIRAVNLASGLPNVVLTALIVLGLVGTLLSTPSTQLLASTQSIHQDFLSTAFPKYSTYTSTRQLWFLRALMLIQTVAIVGLVESLAALGFTIVDLVFAIFGTQLSLFPAVLVGLVSSESATHFKKRMIAAGVIVGFVAGWTTAIVGKATGSGNATFIAPAVSLLVSALFVLFSHLSTHAAPAKKDSQR